MISPAPFRSHPSISEDAGGGVAALIDLGVDDLGKPRLIAVVDDDESIREATKSLLKLLGYHAQSFASAEEFLESQQAHKAACLITDVQMPGMSGVELQSRLISEGHKTPVIFMTAFPQESTRARVLKDGAMGYFSKPLQEESLITCLDKALAGQNSSRE